MSDSFPPHGWYSPWNSPGQNIGVSSLSFLQGIFPTQGSNPAFWLRCRRILYLLSHKGSLSDCSLGQDLGVLILFLFTFLQLSTLCMFPIFDCELIWDVCFLWKPHVLWALGEFLLSGFMSASANFPRFIGLESAFTLTYGLGVPELCKPCTFWFRKYMWKVFRDLVTHRELFLCLPEPLPESRFLATFLNQRLEGSSLSRPLALWKSLWISPPDGFLQPLSFRTIDLLMSPVTGFLLWLLLSSGNFISLSLNMYLTFFIIVFYPRFLHLSNFWRSALPWTTVLLKLEVPSRF